MEPYLWIAEAKRKPILVASLIVCFLLMAALQIYCPPSGISWFAFEFPALADPLINPATWNASDRVIALLGLGIDFVFLLVYPLVLSLLCSHAARFWNLPTKLCAVLKFSALVVWLCVPTDALENVGLLALLWGVRNPKLNWFTSIVAGVKWIVAGWTFLNCFAALLVVTVRLVLPDFLKPRSTS